MNDTVVTITGNVASEIRHTSTPRGVRLASFRLASTARRYDRNAGWVDGHTSFYSVTCWRALADNVAASVRCGEPVVVEGRLRVRPWERDDGRRGVTVEVDASAVGHDLSRGTAAFVRASRETEASPTADRRAADEIADELAAVDGAAKGTGDPADESAAEDSADDDRGVTV